MSTRFQKAPALQENPPPKSKKSNKMAGQAPVTGLNHPPQKKSGRPAIMIELEELVSYGARARPQRKLIESLGSIGCTIKEVAAVLGMHERTMREVFARQPEVKEAFERGKQTGKVSIRHKLHQLAEKNVGAAIFLAKNELGMRDKFEEQPNVSLEQKVLVSIMDKLDGKAGKKIEEPELSAQTPSVIFSPK